MLKGLNTFSQKRPSTEPPEEQGEHSLVLGLGTGDKAAIEVAVATSGSLARGSKRNFHCLHTDLFKHKKIKGKIYYFFLFGTWRDRLRLVEEGRR